MKRILIADDEVNIRILFEAVLAEDGYQTVAVATGREAVRKILKEDYDLIILDIKMPDLNGLEVVEKIRELKKTTPVSICSAFKHLEDDYVIKSGAVSAYLTKPVNLAEMRATVKELLG